MPRPQKKGKPRWRIVAAKAVGTSHRRLGESCEDHFASVTLPNGLHILALADGAGSAARGGEGANVAVSAVIQAAQVALSESHEPESKEGWITLVLSAVQSARDAVENMPTQSPARLPEVPIDSIETQPLAIAVPLREYATTLLLAIVSPERIALGQLGDGMIVAQTGGGTYWCPIPPVNDSQYVNDTHFLTDPDYRDRVQTACLEAGDVQALALLTDGLQVLASTMADHQPYPPFFAPLLAFAAKPDATEAELVAFLESDRVCQRTDDDKTLILAVRI